MKLGSCVWPIKWKPPYEEVIKQIAGMGFKAVELIAWTPDVVDTYYTQQRRKSLVELLRSLNLELAAMHGVTTWNLASRSKALRDSALEAFKKQCDLAVDLETKTVINVAHWPWAPDPDYPYPRMMDRPLYQTMVVDFPPDTDFNVIWKEYVDGISKAAEIAESKGLKYAIEPHPYMLVSNSDAMLRLLDYVKNKVLGFNFDPSHLYPCGEIPQYCLLKLRGRVWHCHFSDNDTTSNVHWTPGKGSIDWEGILATLKTIGYDGYISLELENVPQACHESPTAPEGYVPAGPLAIKEHAIARDYLKNAAKNVGVVLQ